MTDIELTEFENYKIRRLFDEKREIWYFSVIDIVGALTDSNNPRDYWFKMKIRVKSEDGLELSTICRQLKMKAPDGKIAKGARLALEQKTGKSVVTGENFLPQSRQHKKITDEESDKK